MLTVPALFVTGTGTGVGKTHVTSLLTCALRKRGVRARAVKPVETGVTPPGPGPDALALARASGDEAPLGCAYALPLAASPHLSARRAGVRIEASAIYAALRQATPGADLLLVEGAGGPRVPLTDGPRYEVLDLILDLRLPVLLVARAGLGTLNETLLTLEALDRRGVPLLGTVLNAASRPGPPRDEDEDELILADNLAYLSDHAPCDVLGLLPHADAAAPHPADLFQIAIDFDRLLRKIHF